MDTDQIKQGETVYKGYGYNVSGFVRDYVMATFGIEYSRAQEFAEQIDAYLVNADWLSTFNGTQFDRAFDPTRHNNREG